jgi:phage baseplate assembly protein W
MSLVPTSTIVARSVQYSDLDLRMTLHPVKKDIVPLYDVDAIKNSVKILVLSNFYERPFDPFRAGNIRSLLFEQADHFTTVSIKNAISKVLQEREPRIGSVTVIVTDMSDINAYAVSVQFRIVSNLQETTQVDFQLKRLR